MLVQRLGGAMQLDEKYVDGIISANKKYEGSFDEVWLTTSYGFPPLDVHKDYASKLEKVAQKFRDNGIKVSMQLANSIGHGSYIAHSCDCSALLEGEYKTQSLIGPGGEDGYVCFCWNSETFRSYLYQEIEAYCSKVKPDILWIDDDFRAFNHHPVQYGCFCPDCIAKFNKIYGSSFTREELVETILYKDLTWRRRWIDFIRDGLASLMRGLCETIYKCSPNTEYGIQNFCNGAYTGNSLDFLFKEMQAVNGKYPHYRAGGGTYKDHNPNDIIKKNIFITYQHSMMEKKGLRTPEIENSPDIAFGKSPAGTAFETSYYLANGSNGMTYAMMMNLNEPMSWHDNEFKLFSKMRPYWEKLVDISNTTSATGMVYFMSKCACDKTLGEGQGFDELSEENVLACQPLYRDGFPIIFDDCDNGVYMLRPEIAEYISKEEFEMLKTKNVITCGESVAILARRGFELPVKATEVDDSEKNHTREVYTDNPLNGNINKRYKESPFEEGRFCPHKLICEQKDIQVLGHMQFVFDKPNNVDGAIATIVLPLKEGGKWGVFGYAIWRGAKNFTERERILNVADALCGGLSARLLSCEQAIVNIRQDENKEVKAVSITNCTIGTEEDLKVLIRKPCGEKITFQGQYEDFEELSFERSDEGIIVTVPKIAPWSVATIFLSK